MPSDSVPSKKALLLALDDWAAVHHLCRGLIGAGFDVRAIFPSGSVLNHTRFVSKHGRLSSFQKLCSLMLAAENRFGNPIALRPFGWFATRHLAARILTSTTNWSPDVIIPIDDRATRLCRDMLAGRAGLLPVLLSASLLRSLGDPATLEQRLSRSGNYTAALAAGVRVPKQLTVTDRRETLKFASEIGYPVVLKEENSAGGNGVTICPDESSLIDALEKCDSSLFGRLLARLLGIHRRAQRQLVVQQFIRGQATMREIVCWDGKALSGFSLAKMVSPSATGAASVVQSILNREMEHATSGLAETLKLSGFADVDFILDNEGAAYCLELNARPTGLTHLGTRLGFSLEKALFDILAGHPVETSPFPTRDEVIAIFPKEWWRDPESNALHSAYHDVPWDDPEVVNYYVLRRPKSTMN